jgi:hypothetical protein
MFIMGVKLLHSEHSRLKLLNNLNYTVVHRKNAQVHGRFGIAAPDNAGLANDGTLRIGLDDPVTGYLKAGINSEDSVWDAQRVQQPPSWTS